MNAILNSPITFHLRHWIPDNIIHVLSQSTRLSIYLSGESSMDVLTKELVYGLKISEFELQSRNWTQFQTNILGKGLNHLIPPTTITAVLLKREFGIELPTKIDMPLNKETKPFYVVVFCHVVL